MEHNSVLKMWKDYLGTIGEDDAATDKGYESWHFCSNEKDANELAELVLEGKKTGTASALWAYEFENSPLPVEGSLSIVTNWYGEAKCIIRTEGISIVPFRNVSEEHARKEGEGDLSLDYWRKVHEAAFRQDCESCGRQFTYDMPVVCEEFEVVFGKPQLGKV